LIYSIEPQKLLTDNKIGSKYAGIDYGFLYVKDNADLDAEDHISVINTWILDDPKNL
jgi:hypothetical protein